MKICFFSSLRTNIFFDFCRKKKKEKKNYLKKPVFYLMDNIDEVLLEKEKELKEIQSLKLKSIEQKLHEKHEKVLSLEQKLNDLTIIKEAKDLELIENIEKTRKIKQSVQEKSLHISILTEENNKLQIKVQEKEAKLLEYSQTISVFKSDLLKLESNQDKRSLKHEEEIRYMSSLQLSLEKTNEKLRNDLEKIIEKCELYTEKCQNLEAEKIGLTNVFSSKTEEYEKRLESLKSEKGLLELKFEDSSKELLNLKEKHGKRKKKDLKLKEKCDEFEFKIRKLSDENNSKFLQLREKNDQEIRNLRSQLEIKEIQAKTFIEEQRKLQEKIREIEKAYIEKLSHLEHFSQKIQDKLQEITLNLQTKEFEFNRVTQDFEAKLKSSEKTIEKTQEKAKELEKALIFTKQRSLEIERENELLIQEVASYRKTFQNYQEFNKSPLNTKPSNIHNRISKENQDLGLLNEVNEVNSVLFSEDMGPASPLRLSPKRADFQLKKSNFLSRSHEMELRKKIKELENEKADYKKIIEKLAEEMQNVKSKLQLSQQIKDDNLQRMRVLERENEEKEDFLRENERKINKMASFELKIKEFEEILSKKDQEIEEIKKNNRKLSKKIGGLNEERCKLIEISQKMSAKLRAFENEDSETEDETTDPEENNKYSRKIRVLHEKLSVLEGEIMKWRDLENQKNELIDNLRKKIADSYKNPNLLADFEKINDFTSGDSKELEKFKEKLVDLQAEIKRDVLIDVKKKPLVVRNEENLDKNQIYQKNSEKETESQRKIEKILQNNRKSPNMTKKIRNYNYKT